MRLLSELGIIFLLCMAGEGIASLLPWTIPASVISLVLLLLLLLCGGVKESSIRSSADFLTENMGLFFIPAVVGTLEYLDILKSAALPFLLITLVTTPVVYCVTAWTVRGLIRLADRKGEDHA